MLSPRHSRELLQHHVRQIREGTFPYVARPFPRRNWTLYDRAATHEARDMLELTVSATAALADRVPA